MLEVVLPFLLFEYIAGNCWDKKTVLKKKQQKVWQSPWEEKQR